MGAFNIQLPLTVGCWSNQPNTNPEKSRQTKKSHIEGENHRQIIQKDTDEKWTNIDNTKRDKGNKRNKKRRENKQRKARTEV